ncbi:flagellar biosynthesis anti-sigma factor FlgM [Fictibacillus arsenicus]|uniref:Negative regulator of flagellin synthesis n=1 Tax=Fictibacillus arsenicus TaxID=255247 RepID=A0A1B1Z8L5_9BACL|nr:flagellar biosynthesis anti-sigma factor FlgM [Fictibacillus arsenicus]ANX13699.1 flagellar biosynthesis anti-sigma factor FlgM [Fictibacillus arsenicus]
MRINHFNSIQNNPYKKQTQDVKQETVQSAYKKDEIQISDEAKKLLSSSKFEQERADKVNEIKRQVESGNYQVDASRVAKSILDFWPKS